MALKIVRVRMFWTSNIFVIIVFPYTHDTGALTGSAVITHDVTTGTGYCLFGFNWFIGFLS